MLLFIVILLLVGLAVGALGRLAIPGPDPMSIPMTIAVGVGGSFIGGLISSALLGRNAGSLLISVICAAGIVYLMRRRRGGDLRHPAPPPV
ncbi:MAG: hypothetical protein QOE11_3323 [Solirubrobacteraceae bacterium]|jgi:uncharacterized membrane protein YeaQ/YmgE (transglycosylase-associated protein family)|nr:hypothetical protein [Solirubrobacteraceae bacterium]